MDGTIVCVEDIPIFNNLIVCPVSGAPLSVTRLGSPFASLVNVHAELGWTIPSTVINKFASEVTSSVTSKITVDPSPVNMSSVNVEVPPVAAALTHLDVAVLYSIICLSAGLVIFVSVRPTKSATAVPVATVSPFQYNTPLTL